MATESANVADLISTAEVAEILAVPVSTLHNWIDRNLLVPALKGQGLRGAMWFARADVDRLARYNEATDKVAELRVALAAASTAKARTAIGEDLDFWIGKRAALSPTLAAAEVSQ